MRLEDMRRSDNAGFSADSTAASWQAATPSPPRRSCEAYLGGVATGGGCLALYARTSTLN
jgi:hypothetical protein